MLRLVLASLLVTVAGASLAACDHCVMDNLSCRVSSTITAHLQTTRDVLLASVPTLCVNGSCQPLTIAPPVSTGGGAPSYGAGGMVDLGGGWLEYSWTQVDPALSDGDSFTLTISDPTGAPLLDVSRTAVVPQYAPTSACDDGCGRPSPAFDLYATSQSGQHCTGKGLGGEVTLTGDLDGAAWSTSSSITVCHNDDCSTGQVESFGATETEGEAAEEDYGALSSGPLFGFTLDLATTTNTNASGAQGGGYTVKMNAEPEQLHDGDIYRVTLDDGSVYTRQATATYDESYPDGKSCDAMPQRNASVKM